MRVCGHGLHFFVASTEWSENVNVFCQCGLFMFAAGAIMSAKP
jgi:hypothetical protein